jgi:hypothetical protein
MGEVRLDAAEVHALAQRVLDGAEVLDEIRWPTMARDALMGSSVGPATAIPEVEERLADLVAHLRTWASAARTAAAALEQADVNHVDRLGEPR